MKKKSIKSLEIRSLKPPDLMTRINKHFSGFRKIFIFAATNL